jgi:large subunit ribosomal protein L25
MVQAQVKTLKATLRSNTGSRTAEKARNADRVPAVVYGPELEENLHIEVDELAVEKLLRVKQRQVIKLEFEDGKTFDTIIRTIDFHPVSDRPIHLDFYLMADGKSFETVVPVKITGKSKGVASGGRLVQRLRDVRVKTTKDKLPAEVEIDVTRLEIGQSIKIREVEFTDFDVLTDPQNTVAVIRAPRVANA